ncbi:MAG: rhodanese-like domain-containing protein [Terrabacter sp.]|nr:rhodanese-like domain-containing protein [Terrabacter sp.]
MSRPRTIDEVLAEARGRLQRLTPEQAEAARADGALVVDIRPAAQRAAVGELPFVTVIERNVLEWRLDPSSDASLPVASHDLEVIVLCQEGYTSSLAAAALQDLGIHRATDVIGGYAAWRAWLADAPSSAGPSGDAVPQPSQPSQPS